MDLAPVPGFSPTHAQLRRRGVAFSLCLALIAFAVWGVQALRPQDVFTLTLRTPTVAAGIVEGAKVRIQGLDVGSVSGIRSLGNAQQGVTLRLDGPQGRSLTNNVEAAFSAGNLFGVSEVILTPHEGGGALRDGAELAPTRPITDNTVSNMIATLGDVNNDALRPYMGQVLLNFDASSKAMLPLLTALGSVAQTMQDTQRLSTAETFPTVVAALKAADPALGAMIPAFQSALDHTPLHNGDSKKTIAILDDGINDERAGLIAGLQAILTPQAVDGLKTASPMLLSLLQPILAAFPNGSAGGVGIQLSQLLDNVRKAMPNTPNGPVLNLRLSVDYPAVAAALPPGVDTAKPGTPASSAKPTPGKPATPSTTPSATSTPR
ncbi:MlaD family protein [Tsukamurella ocularis]|uniref:MlaD family protein n=1 Tax=Tsukamurella ocularis TaxID=1970234 RepID=UPI002166C84F|nr:MCE family protein [Tsukamurella ocularis]MCS3779566.1 phospholipid/cholesterol/gamma-HCH transport system substrate-binding protein [Tsukamurella ocularis]MCS3789034.1 phospholipid/cholesterol/gamma-HCH transport system substrate-binding protein [Tsukamurella ocularis]MCS3850244.1 phospholipid/cholesterol/gamma-HCH transport system substrate-binding protein [Tsukamurella ocularis]